MNSRGTFSAFLVAIVIVIGQVVVNGQSSFVVTVVDDFSVPSANLKCNGPCYPIVGTASGPGILGGARLVQLQADQGSITCESVGSSLEFDVTGHYAGNQTYYYTQSAQLIYDGNDYPLNPNGLGNVDLYSGQGQAFFEVLVLNSAQKDFWTMNITVYSGNNNCTSHFSPCTADTDCVTYVPFSAFPSCDMRNVGAITLSVFAIYPSTQSGASIALKSFGAVNQGNPMPTGTHMPTPYPSASPSPYHYPSPSPLPYPSSSPIPDYRIVGNYTVNSGPPYMNNPPCYTCQQACAMVFGGSASSYHCSTSSSNLSYQAYATSFGVSGCQVTSDNYSLSTNYNCGVIACSSSAYCADNCFNTNYCWST